MKMTSDFVLEKNEGREVLATAWTQKRQEISKERLQQSRYWYSLTGSPFRVLIQVIFITYFQFSRERERGSRRERRERRRRKDGKTLDAITMAVVVPMGLGPLVAQMIWKGKTTAVLPAATPENMLSS